MEVPRREVHRDAAGKNTEISRSIEPPTCARSRHSRHYSRNQREVLKPLPKWESTLDVFIAGLVRTE